MYAEFSVCKFRDIIQIAGIKTVAVIFKLCKKKKQKSGYALSVPFIFIAFYDYRMDQKPGCF